MHIRSVNFPNHVTAGKQPKYNSAANVILFLTDLRPAEFSFDGFSAGPNFCRRPQWPNVRQLRGLVMNKIDEYINMKNKEVNEKNM